VDLAEYGRMRQIAVRLSSRGRSLLAASVEIGGNRWEQVDVYKVSRRCPVTAKLVTILMALLYCIILKEVRNNSVYS